MTALFPSLSLFLPVPIFSWLPLLLRQGPWVCYLGFAYVCAHLLLGRGFPMLLAILRPPLGSGSTGSSGYSSPLGFLPSRCGHPCRVEVCLSSIETKASCPRLGRVHWSVLSWTSRLCLRRLCAPSLRVCCQVVLAVSVSLGCP